MAHTLPLPAAYFLGVGETSGYSQPIYMPFGSISGEFHSNYVRDFGLYSCKYPSDDSLTIESLCNALNASDELYEFATVGFIVSLFRKIVALRVDSRKQ